MSAAKELKAVLRDRVGKGAARAVRRNGQVPAVIYGGKEAATPIALDFNSTRHLILAGHFLTTVFNIDVDGKAVRAIPRDYQLDPVRDTPLHVDFFRLEAGASVDVDVPVHFEGQETSPGLKRGGTLNVVLHAVGLVVPAESIPEALVVDVSSLDIGDVVHVSDVRLPSGAKLATADDAERTVASIAAPSALGEEAEAEAAAVTEAAKAESDTGKAADAKS